MSSRRLPTGTVSPPSREGRVRPRTDEAAASERSSAPADRDELARENRRLERENRRLRERLDAERSERQAIIDRYEGLVDDRDAPASAAESHPASPRRASADASRPSLLVRVARVLGLR